MKKIVTGILLGCLLIAAAGLFWMNVRQAQYDYGREQGYLMGYSIAYTDKCRGETQNSQLLAGRIVPFEFGNSKWKGFMMGFPEGYSEGLGRG